jgi:hypothetical protein
MTNTRLISVALACIGITASGTTLFASTARRNVSPDDPPPSRIPAYGVVGVGLKGICAEIEAQRNDPRRLTDCELRRLSRLNLDIDHPPAQARSADILVENGLL